MVILCECGLVLAMQNTTLLLIVKRYDYQNTIEAQVAQELYVLNILRSNVIVLTDRFHMHELATVDFIHSLSPTREKKPRETPKHKKKQ